MHSTKEGPTGSNLRHPFLRYLQNNLLHHLTEGAIIFPRNENWGLYFCCNEKTKTKTWQVG